MTLAQYLRNKRLRLGQSQGDAARVVGVSRLTWLRWEAGQIPYADKLPAIADWAGVSLNRLRPFLEEAAAPEGKKIVRLQPKVSAELRRKPCGRRSGRKQKRTSKR